MRSIFYSLVALITFSACTKDIDNFTEIRPEKHPEFPASVTPTVDKSPYMIPVIKTSDDFVKVIHIDPDYKGNDSDGSVEKPYTSINFFRAGVPANTAFLVKRGTTHEKIGRRVGGNHEHYTSMIYNNNFIGPYGTGERPVIEGFWIMGGSNGLTIRDIHIYAESQQSPGHDAVVYMHNSAIHPKATPAARCNDITIAYSIIEGKLNENNYFNPTPYPQMGIKFEANNFTLYHSIIRNIWADGVYAGGGENHRLIRNWIHEVNHMASRAINENWPNPGSPDPHSEDVGGGGDCFQAAGASNGFYLAGNYFDRSNTTWKFGVIFNTGWESSNTGLIIEHNTFIHPKGGLGGAAHYYNVPPGTITRYNFYNATNADRQKGTTTFASGNGETLKKHLTQKAPYGPRNNHIIRHYPGSSITYPDRDEYLDPSNLIFDSFSDYLKHLKTNDPVGSDIDTNDFWQGIF
jgi:hypothetical protein